MQAQENLSGITTTIPNLTQPLAQSETSRPLNWRRRLIRRLREGRNQSMTQRRLNNKSLKLRWLRARKQNYKQMMQKQATQQAQTKSDQSNKLKNEKKDAKNLQKIEFDLSLLPNEMQESYKKKQKLKNTELMVPGIKFVNELTLKAISKWQKALIIYQQQYLTSKKRYHFGLLLKYMNRLITFDGIKNLWPIQTVRKSFHWQKQDDTWSCGYRALFWIRKIQEVGIDRWVKEFEIDSLPSNLQYDY